jgi:hypothetical protein
VLKNRSGVGPPDYVEDMADYLLVVPAGGELGLAWLPDSVPVPAATRLAVEYVRGPLRRDVDILRRWPVLGIHRIPSRTIRVARPTAAICCPAVGGGPERLVVLFVTTRLGRFRPPRRNITTRNLALGAVEVIIRPV